MLFYPQDSFCVAVLVNVNGSRTVKYIKDVQILLFVTLIFNFIRYL